MQKNILKICLGILCSFCFLFGSSSTTFAASKTLNVTRVRQAKSNWCWAASSEMVGRYGVSTSRDQWAVVNLIWGPTYPNQPGSVANMVSGVQFVSNYTKQAKSSSSLLSLSNIQSRINSGKPMIARLAWNSGDGHAIVLSGYSNSQIRCIDPWENTSTTYYEYNKLKNGGSFLTGTGKATHTVYY